MNRKQKLMGEAAVLGAGGLGMVVLGLGGAREAGLAWVAFCAIVALFIAVGE